MSDYDFSDGPEFNHAKSWTTIFDAVIGQPNIHSLEIGCNEGKSAVWMLNHVLTDPTSTLTCVDCWSDSVNDGRTNAHLAESRFDANIEFSGRHGSVRKIVGYSEYVLPSLRGMQFDTCYIDAAHDARSALVDSVLAWPLVKSGGVIVWDDYLWTVGGSGTECPKLGIDAFLSVYSGKWRYLSINWQMAIQKI